MGLGATAVGQILYVDDVVVDRVGPAAPPLTPTMTMPGGVPTFKFQTLAGHRYRMVYKNALADAAWSTIAGADWTHGNRHGSGGHGYDAVRCRRPATIGSRFSNCRSIGLMGYMEAGGSNPSGLS